MYVRKMIKYRVMQGFSSEFKKYSLYAYTSLHNVDI